MTVIARVCGHPCEGRSSRKYCDDCQGERNRRKQADYRERNGAHTPDATRRRNLGLATREHRAGRPFVKTLYRSAHPNSALRRKYATEAKWLDEFDWSEEAADSERVAWTDRVEAGWLVGESWDDERRSDARDLAELFRCDQHGSRDEQAVYDSAEVYGLNFHWRQVSPELFHPRGSPRLPDHFVCRFCGEVVYLNELTARERVGSEFGEPVYRWKHHCHTVGVVVARIVSGNGTSSSREIESKEDET